MNIQRYLAKRLKALLAWLSFISVLIAPNAFAQTTTFFEPTPGDKSLALMNSIFANLFPDWGYAAAHMGLETAIGSMNAAALLIGGFMISYTMVFGTMATAHEGEMMGKKFSSMWVPIRLVVGAGLVVPVSNYCVGQMFVAWAIVQGVGLADNVWNKYLDGVLDAGSFAPVATSPSVETAAALYMKSIACKVEWNKLVGNPSAADSDAAGGSEKIKESLGTTEITFKRAPAVTRTLPGGNQEVITYEKWGTDGTAQQNIGDSACGAIKFNATQYAAATDAMVGGSPAGGASAPKSVMGDTLSKDLERYILKDQDIVDAHIQATEEMVSRLEPLVIDIINTDSTGFSPGYDQFQQAVDGYRNTILRILSARSSGAMEAMIAQMKADGWIMAGSWFMRAAFLQDVLNRAIGLTPQYQAMENMEVFGPAGSSISKAMAKLDGWHTRNSDILMVNRVAPRGIEGNSISAIYESGMDSMSNAPHGRVEADKRFASMLIGPLKSEIKRILDQAPTRHPLMTLKDFGDAVLSAVEKAVFAHVRDVEAGAQFGLNQQMVATAVSVLYTIGVTFGVYMPMAPFILFIMTAIAWFFMCIEAVFAAPIWGIMKLMPGGDDIMGQARNAYGMLLSLAIRPVLIVMGFCCSLVVIEPLLRFFNDLFLSSARMSLMGGFNSVFIAGAVACVYFGLLQTLIWKVFGLVHEFPDNIPKWMGLAGEKLGDFATRAEQGAQQFNSQTAQKASTEPASYRPAPGGGGQQGNQPKANTTPDKQEKAQQPRAVKHEGGTGKADAKTDHKPEQPKTDQQKPAHSHARTDGYRNNVSDRAHDQMTRQRDANLTNSHGNTEDRLTHNGGVGAWSQNGSSKS